MNGGPVLPVIVYVVAEVLDEFRHEMGLDRFVRAARYGNARWPVIARVAADSFEGRTVKSKNGGRAKLPAFALLDRVDDHAAGAVELVKAVPGFRFRPKLLVLDQIRLIRHAVATLFTH